MSWGQCVEPVHEPVLFPLPPARASTQLFCCSSCWLRLTSSMSPAGSFPVREKSAQVSVVIVNPGGRAVRSRSCRRGWRPCLQAVSSGWPCHRSFARRSRSIVSCYGWGYESSGVQWSSSWYFAFSIEPWSCFIPFARQVIRGESYCSDDPMMP